MLVELWLAVTWFMYSYNPDVNMSTPMGQSCLSCCLLRCSLLRACVPRLGSDPLVLQSATPTVNLRVWSLTPFSRTSFVKKMKASTRSAVPSCRTCLSPVGTSRFQATSVDRASTRTCGKWPCFIEATASALLASASFPCKRENRAPISLRICCRRS